MIDSDLFSVASKGRLLIVDDDPVVSSMLSESLKPSGFEVIEVESGFECLARIEAIEPDVIFLDIEMPGIDGYETCRKLRAAKHTQGLIIIFLSTNDDVDSRLAAFDAGADDFVAKPFNPEEISRKATVAVKLRAERLQLQAEKALAHTGAKLALTMLEEINIVLDFTRNSMSCRSLQSLAQLAVKSLKSYGLTSNVQIRSHYGLLTLSPEGSASPLAASIIELTKEQGRIFQFKQRLIVNFPAISLLIMDMPVEDISAASRIRDYVLMIGETSVVAVDNIILRLDEHARTEGLRELVDATQVALKNLHHFHRTLQSDTRFGLDQMIRSVEGMYTSLGLLDSQEYAISDVVRNAVTRVMDLLERGSTTDDDFKQILTNLSMASEYRVALAEERSQAGILSPSLRNL